MRTKAKTIDDYIAVAPEAAQERLWEMLAAVRRGAPGAEEGIKWGMPALIAPGDPGRAAATPAKGKRAGGAKTGRILVMFGAFKKHVGFFPTGSVLSAFAEETAGYEQTRGGLKFPLEKRVPAALVTKMTRARVRENAESDKLWKTGGKKKK